MTGVIDGLPIAEYLRDAATPGPSLSASLAHVLLTRSPLHCWRAHPKLNPDWEPDEPEERQSVGTIVHAILLEGDRSRIVVIEAEDYRTKVAKEARDLAHVQGKRPILVDRMAEVEAAVEAARAQLAESEIPDAFIGGHAERTLIWTDADGVTWRSRPDWMDDKGLLLLDLKTTGGSAEPDAWARGPLLAHGADLQAALGLRGARALLGPAERTFVFVVLETAPPYALSLVGLDPQFMEFAESKLDAAARRWTACRQDGVWPGYSPRIAWASPPEWAVYRWGERMVLTPDAPDDGVGEVSAL